MTSAFERKPALHKHKAIGLPLRLSSFAFFSLSSFGISILDSDGAGNLLLTAAKCNGPLLAHSRKSRYATTPPSTPQTARTTQSEAGASYAKSLPLPKPRAQRAAL